MVLLAHLATELFFKVLQTLWIFFSVSLEESAWLLVTGDFVGCEKM